MIPLAEESVEDWERDRLYGLPLEEFVRARNGLAARLRKAGKTDAAAEIAALRKPSAPLWAINQLARTDPGAVARLLDATDALRSAQLGRDRGGDPGARAAAQRGALDRLVDRAASLLYPDGSDVPADTRARLSASLLGAAADRGLREDLHRGRLDRELKAPGFEVFAGARPVTPAATTPAPARPPRRDARRQREAEARAEAAVRAARKEARALEAKADRLARAAAEKERAAASAKEAAERARQAASGAGAGLRAAEERLAGVHRTRVE
jgi:hypothetical protein